MEYDFEAEIIAIYNKYGDGIFFFCVSRLFDRELAKEASAEVFLKLVERYPLLKRKSQEENDDRIIRNWLYGTAKNSISRQIRHAKHQKKIAHNIAFTSNQPQSIQDDCEKDEKLGAIFKAVSKLSPDDQEIVMLRFLHGYQTSVIAEIIGVEHAATRARLSRVIRKLKNMLGIVQ